MSAILKQIESLHDQAVRELHEEVRAERLKREERKREYRYRVHAETLRGISIASDAALAPTVESFAEAIRCLREAQNYAELLKDMEES